MTVSPLLAVFVGGRSRRMGQPKGLLSVPGRDESIVEALVRLGGEADLNTVLVGDASPYGGVAAATPRLDDDPPGGGPLAGLRASLKHALAEAHPHVLAVACDMPFVTAEAFAELCAHPASAAVVAPRRTESAPWEPMLARYDAAAVLPVLDTALAKGTRSFQALFALLDVEPLPLTPAVEAALRDWDTPADVAR